MLYIQTKQISSHVRVVRIVNLFLHYAASSVNAPVQEGDVSSSNPPILATELFGSALQVCNVSFQLILTEDRGSIIART